MRNSPAKRIRKIHFASIFLPSAAPWPGETSAQTGEITRRGLELFLDRYPQPQSTATPWRLPRVDGGGIKVPLDQLTGLSAADEATRSLTRCVKAGPDRFALNPNPARVSEPPPKPLTVSITNRPSALPCCR